MFTKLDRITYKRQKIPFLQKLGKDKKTTLVFGKVLEHKPEYIQPPHQSFIPAMYITNEQKNLIDLEVIALQQKLTIDKVSEPNNYHSN